jgi:hypothetical protein
MKNSRQNQLRLSGLLLLGSALCLPGLLPAATSDYEPGWRIRFFAASIDFDNAHGYRSRVHPGSDFDIGFGLGFNAEYRFSRRLGLDLGILGGAAIDAAWNVGEGGEWVWSAYDTLTFTPLSVGLDIHLTPDNNVDLYLCPMLSWVHYGGLVVHSADPWTATTVDFNEDLGIGIALGLGVPIGQREHWLFSANLIHLESEIESRGWSGDRLADDYDATILGLGFGYKF